MGSTISWGVVPRPGLAKKTKNSGPFFSYFYAIAILCKANYTIGIFDTIPGESGKKNMEHGEMKSGAFTLIFILAMLSQAGGAGAMEEGQTLTTFDPYGDAGGAPP